MVREPIKTASKGRVLIAIGVLVAGACALAGLGITNRARSMEDVDHWTEAQAVPTVHVVYAKQGAAEQDLTLPGTVRAFAMGSLYARASGYITSWTKDIGARVHKGDVLAEISAPDLDQQLAEARATLVQLQANVEQAQANADLGDATNQRTTRLVAQGWSSASQGDTDRFTAASRKAALAVAKANVVTQQAAVSRLEELVAFKQIKAPFDGVVTARAVDIGDLVNAGGTTGHALFRVSDIHKVRIYVNVPQAFLGSMTRGLRASLRLPGQKTVFQAAVTSTANALAEDSRTALVELEADNADGKMWPGAFCEVQFHIPSTTHALHIPTTALLFGKDGTRVAVVGKDDRVALQPVMLGRNLGIDVEITGGIGLTDRLVDNPQEMISQGDLVKVAGTPTREPNARSAAANGAASREAAR